MSSLVNRKKSAIKNVSVNMISYFINTLLRFFVRYVFILKIGTEFLGLNSIFTSIISVFSLAEMGFSLTIGAMLYKPISENDVKKIKSLINLTKKIFYTIGFIVLFGGCLVIPFLQFLVSNTTIAISHIRIYYILHVLSTCITYFSTHKVVLMSADQKQYIHNKIIIFSNIVTAVIQVILLFIHKNYISFVLTQLIVVVLQNVVLSIVTNKLYPYLKDKNTTNLTKEERKEFYKKSFGAFFYKLGTIVVNATDSILISSATLLGVVVLGKYSNYTLIFTNISQLAYVCVAGAIASIGNLWVTSDNKKVIDIFKKLQFIQLWISIFCTTCLLCLTQPVINFVGNLMHQDLTMDLSIVIISCVNFYLTTMQTIINLFKNSKGLFWHDRYKALLEAVINLISSLILMKFLGIFGVLLGTTISIVLVNVWYEPYVLYKHGFDKEPMKNYFKDYIFNLILTLVICVLTYMITIILPSGLIWLFVKCGICLILPNIIMLIVFGRTEKFKYCKNLVFSLVKKSKQ